MSKIEMYYLIEALKEWEKVMEEAKAEADAIRDQIKAELIAQETEEMEVGNYIVRYTSVLSNRFDTTSFKREHNDLYQQFTKQTASRRFSIA